MNIGDTVIKGSDVMRIVERKSEAIAGGPSKEYWILETAYPTGNTSCKMHVPVDREDEMLKPVPTRQDWDQVINDAKNADCFKWNKDRMKRIEEFHAIVSSGKLVDAIRLERTFRAYRKADEHAKLSTRDKDFENKACEFVTSAAAASFGVTPGEASEMLEKAIG